MKIPAKCVKNFIRYDVSNAMSMPCDIAARFTYYLNQNPVKNLVSLSPTILNIIDRGAKWEVFVNLFEVKKLPSIVSAKVCPEEVIATKG